MSEGYTAAYVESKRPGVIAAEMTDLGNRRIATSNENLTLTADRDAWKERAETRDAELNATQMQLGIAEERFTAAEAKLAALDTRAAAREIVKAWEAWRISVFPTALKVFGATQLAEAITAALSEHQALVDRVKEVEAEHDKSMTADAHTIADLVEENNCDAYVFAVDWPGEDRRRRLGIGEGEARGIT